MLLINNEKDIGRDLLESLQDPEFCDVKIVAREGEEIPVSKVILSVRSQYFRSMFSSNNNLTTPDKVAVQRHFAKAHKTQPLQSLKNTYTATYFIQVLSLNWSLSNSAFLRSSSILASSRSSDSFSVAIFSSSSSISLMRRLASGKTLPAKLSTWL